MRQHFRGLPRWLLIALLATLLGASAALAQTGGGYDLTWSTIDAGGAESSGGGYQLAGTVGQPDAGGALTGGAYALAGGFWGGAAKESKVHLPLMQR